MTIHLEGATQDSAVWPAKAHDEISLDYEADSNALHGLYEQNSSVKKGEDTPVWLGDLHNPYGELLMKRNAVRYVKEFGARIVEWDAWVNGNNDWAAWRYLSPLHPLADRPALACVFADAAEAPRPFRGASGDRLVETRANCGSLSC